MNDKIDVEAVRREAETYIAKADNMLERCPWERVVKAVGQLTAERDKADKRATAAELVLFNSRRDWQSLIEQAESQRDALRVSVRDLQDCAVTAEDQRDALQAKVDAMQAAMAKASNRLQRSPDGNVNSIPAELFAPYLPKPPADPLVALLASVPGGSHAEFAFHLRKAIERAGGVKAVFGDQA